VSGLAPSSRFVEDGSFIKLRELAVRYRIGADPLQAVPVLRGFDGLTLSVVGRNLFTWTDYDGYDPRPARWRRHGFGCAGPRRRVQLPAVPHVDVRHRAQLLMKNTS
jgi:hypothetical protein